MKEIDCEFCNRYPRPKGLGADPKPSDRECIHTCLGCGYHGDRVDCSGIYFCPNPLCRACGATGSILRKCKALGVKVTSSHEGYDIADEDVRLVQDTLIRECTDTRLLAFLHMKYPSRMSDVFGLPLVAIFDRDLGDEQVQP